MENKNTLGDLLPLDFPENTLGDLLPLDFPELEDDPTDIEDDDEQVTSKQKKKRRQEVSAPFSQCLRDMQEFLGFNSLGTTMEWLADVKRDAMDKVAAEFYQRKKNLDNYMQGFYGRVPELTSSKSAKKRRKQNEIKKEISFDRKYTAGTSFNKEEFFDEVNRIFNLEIPKPAENIQQNDEVHQPKLSVSPQINFHGKVNYRDEIPLKEENPSGVLIHQDFYNATHKGCYNFSSVSKINENNAEGSEGYVNAQHYFTNSNNGEGSLDQGDPERVDDYEENDLVSSATRNEYLNINTPGLQLIASGGKVNVGAYYTSNQNNGASYPPNNKGDARMVQATRSYMVKSNSGKTIACQGAGSRHGKIGVTGYQNNWTRKENLGYEHHRRPQQFIEGVGAANKHIPSLQGRPVNTKTVDGSYNGNDKQLGLDEFQLLSSARRPLAELPPQPFLNNNKNMELQLSKASNVKHTISSHSNSQAPQMPRLVPVHRVPQGSGQIFQNEGHQYNTQAVDVGQFHPQLPNFSK